MDQVPVGEDAMVATAGAAPMAALRDRVAVATAPVETAPVATVAGAMDSATNPVETIVPKPPESTHAVPKMGLHQRATGPTVVSTLSGTPARKVLHRRLSQRLMASPVHPTQSMRMDRWRTSPNAGKSVGVAPKTEAAKPGKIRQ